MLPIKSEVLSFISQFSDMREGFLNGKCFWFAQILHMRFPLYGVMYNQIDNHWACLISDWLFDASGEIYREGFEAWPSPDIGGSHMRGLLKNCILLTGDEDEEDLLSCNGYEEPDFNNGERH